MKIVVIDGQGGKIGKTSFPEEIFTGNNVDPMLFQNTDARLKICRITGTCRGRKPDCSDRISEKIIFYHCCTPSDQGTFRQHRWRSF